MIHAAETFHANPHQLTPRLNRPSPAFDILATLSQTLGTAWIVQRETDCDGEVSVLALAASDEDNAMPTFILYEKDGLAHVATVTDDEWQSQPGFASTQEAVAAIAAEAARLSINLPAAIRP